MKLISDIINELIDTDKSISSALLKTKVLASRVQNKELFDWVSSELGGYDLESKLPEYRISVGAITGTYINGNMQYNNQPLATAGLNENLEKIIRSVEFYQSVASLESLAKDNESGTLTLTFPAEFAALIEQNYRKMGNPFFQIVNAKRTTSINVITDILSVVRNKLLDFMLKVDEEFGNITEIEELKTKKEQISTIMSQTIINTSGDGNIINTGNNSQIKAKININKGNKDELASHLKELGVEEADTTELLEVIDSEKVNPETKTFGKKVNVWIQKMVGKALDGSWNVGVGAAGNLLAEAIKLYYGM